MTDQPRDAQDELAVCNQATPGPWAFEPIEWECPHGVDSGHDEFEQCPEPDITSAAGVTKIFTIDQGDYFGLNDNDAAFIAAAREMAPYWINRCLEAEKRLAKNLNGKTD